MDGENNQLAPWENTDIPEMERWLMMLEAVDNGTLKFDEMIKIAQTFSEEVKELIRQSAQDSLISLN